MSSVRQCVICKAATDELPVTLFIGGEARPVDLCGTHMKPIRRIFDAARGKPPEDLEAPKADRRDVHRVEPID